MQYLFALLVQNVFLVVIVSIMPIKKEACPLPGSPPAVLFVCLVCYLCSNFRVRACLESLQNETNKSKREHLKRILKKPFSVLP